MTETKQQIIDEFRNGVLSNPPYVKKDITVNPYLFEETKRIVFRGVSLIRSSGLFFGYDYYLTYGDFYCKVSKQYFNELWDAVNGVYEERSEQEALARIRGKQ